MDYSKRSQAGQSSVEYALVLFAFLAAVLALGALWAATKDGRVADLARRHASHNGADGVSAQLMQDILAY